MKELKILVILLMVSVGLFSFKNYENSKAETYEFVEQPPELISTIYVQFGRFSTQAEKSSIRNYAEGKVGKFLVVSCVQDANAEIWILSKPYKLTNDEDTANGSVDLDIPDNTPFRAYWDSSFISCGF